MLWTDPANPAGLSQVGTIEGNHTLKLLNRAVFVLNMNTRFVKYMYYSSQYIWGTNW